MARYEVEHVFFNPTEQQLEGTFRFPLPSGSIVTGLALEVDGKLMDGEMPERERAREICEDRRQYARPGAARVGGRADVCCACSRSSREHARGHALHGAAATRQQAGGFAVEIPARCRRW
jgi:hypothetical protein